MITLTCGLYDRDGVTLRFVWEYGRQHDLIFSGWTEIQDDVFVFTSTQNHLQQKEETVKCPSISSHKVHLGPIHTRMFLVNTQKFLVSALCMSHQSYFLKTGSRGKRLLKSCYVHVHSQNTFWKQSHHHPTDMVYSQRRSSFLLVGFTVYSQYISFIWMLLVLFPIFVYFCGNIAVLHRWQF